MKALFLIIAIFSFATAIGMFTTDEQVEQDHYHLSRLIMPVGFNSKRLCKIIERGIASDLLRFYLYQINKIDPTLINGQDDWEWTPLHWAAKTLNVGAIEVLLSFHARIDIKNNDGDTPYSLGSKVWQNRKDDVYRLYSDSHRLSSNKYRQACNLLQIMKKAVDSLRNPSEEAWGMSFSQGS